jgi:hypothetical protein
MELMMINISSMIKWGKKRRKGQVVCEMCESFVSCFNFLLIN